MYTYTSLAAPSRWSRVWRWLKYGGMIHGGATYLEASKPRPLAVPWRTWRALARHRRIIPSPLLYLVVAGIGLLVGVVLQFTLVVWWLLPPLAPGDRMAGRVHLDLVAPPSPFRERPCGDPVRNRPAARVRGAAPRTA